MNRTGAIEGSYNMFLFKRKNGFWYVGFYKGKARVNVSCRSKNKTDANEFFRAFRAETKGNVRLELLKVKALEYAGNLQPKTVSQYRITLTALMEYLHNEKLEHVTKTDLQNYIASRKGYSKYSLNIEIAVIKKAFAIAVEKKYISDNPARELKKFKVKSEVESFRQDELELFLNELIKSKQMHYYYAVILALNTGMRKGEICNLKWSDINFTERTIKLRNKITKVLEHAYFNDEAARVFDELRQSNIISTEGYLWGKALNERNLSRTFNRVRDSLGLSKHLRFHSTRHTAITRWANSMNLHIAQDLARHSTPAMTKKYVHTRHEELKKAINE